ncbi:transposable element-related [Holotrichia oblita]|uniref:Transposable element-related n=1 Tax=Holotrichia oblita TaxID=644536 RepID=A0ACB9SY67_HOLOL|nr:transposable element-related [Holotrichia oblita]
MWSDESNIELFGQPGAAYVRRRPREAYNAECIIPTVKFGGGSIMVWGYMTATGVGVLLLCERRMNSHRYIEVLEEVLEPSALQLFDEDVPDYIFQQDNAPCHKLRAVTSWFRENNVRVLEWPAQSSDLSPIEHLWGILKVKVSKFKCTSKDMLKTKIRDAWNSITPEECFRFIASMPRRVHAVINAKGGTPKY